MVLRLSRRAQVDASRITLGARSKKAAQAWREDYAAALQRITQTPLMYQERADVAAGYRAAPAGRYHLWYIVNDNTGVRVQRILPQATPVTASMPEEGPRH